jgi:hypothetical protein
MRNLYQTSLTLICINETHNLRAGGVRGEPWFPRNNYKKEEKSKSVIK